MACSVSSCSLCHIISARTAKTSTTKAMNTRIENIYPANCMEHLVTSPDTKIHREYPRIKTSFPTVVPYLEDSSDFAARSPGFNTTIA